MSDILIWWLSCADQDAIGAPRDEWPDYLRREYISREGRAGRGRLWVAPDFADAMATWTWPQQDTPMSLTIGRCGGIVIRAIDAHHLDELPGIITDLGLRRWRPR